MSITAFDIAAHQWGHAPIYLPCLAASPSAAILIGRRAFPGFLLTVSHRGQQHNPPSA
jgi:hypothetical protein